MPLLLHWLILILQRKYHLNYPLTSIRRALTNLTGALHLQKNEIKVQGIYGMPEHTWKLASNVENIYTEKIKSACDIASDIINGTLQGKLF